MDRDSALTRLQGIEAEIAALHAEQAQLLVLVASSAPVVEELLVLDRRPGHDGERMIRIEDAVREEVAAALRWSTGAAHARIDQARLLAGPLTATAAALAAGEISLGHVGAIADGARRFAHRWSSAPDERAAFTAACARLQERVLPTARRGNLSMTRRAVTRAVLSIDAVGEARRRREARCTRDVYVIDELDGISTVVARLATEQAHALMAAVDAAAAGAAAPTAGERRADALAGLVMSGGAEGSSASHVRLDVVVGLDQLLGDDPSGAVELRGSGSVSMGLLCALLADPDTTATMRRLVVDPCSGHLLDVGRRTYEVPRRLREYIAMRDRRCRFPGCGRRADRCQVDHAIAWDDGGATSPDNLGALCVRHHQLKTFGGWDVVDSRADGSCTWVSPRGRRYDHHPPPL
jgi:Domain of unknown function (DUF222)/HNH endonuclease